MDDRTRLILWLFVALAAGIVAGALYVGLR